MVEGVQRRQLALEGLRVQPASLVQVACCLGSIRKECKVHGAIMRGARFVHVVVTAAVPQCPKARGRAGYCC